MVYKINKNEVEQIKEIYTTYKKAFKEQLNKEASETAESTKRHLQSKFKYEDELMKKFISNPTSANFYRVSNGIFGPNEGNRYTYIEKILDRFDNIKMKIFSR